LIVVVADGKSVLTTLRRDDFIFLPIIYDGLNLVIHDVIR